jgi:prepilin-type N-terminal cleavage/methylation domain-containing protein
MNNNVDLENKNRGFTIVELLIVIVIIAILVAITIVAYSGITARANTSSAQNAAGTVIKKVIAHNAELGTYPASSAALTGALNSTTYYLATGVVAFDGTVLSSSNLPAAPAEVNFYKCGIGNTTPKPTTLAGITTQTGVRIDYWNYSTSAVTSMSTGTIEPAMVGTYNVGCVLSS